MHTCCVSLAIAIMTRPKAPSPSTPQTEKSSIDGARRSPAAGGGAPPGEASIEEPSNTRRGFRSLGSESFRERWSGTALCFNQKRFEMRLRYTLEIRCAGLRRDPLQDFKERLVETHARPSSPPPMDTGAAGW